MRLGQALTVLLSMLSITSILSIALRANLSQPWSYRDSDLQSILACWAATGAMSIVTGLIITAFSVYLVWSLQMDSKPKSRSSNNDAASENSESAIIVKTTVNVSDSRGINGTSINESR